MRGYTITDVGKVRSENQDCVRFIQNTLPSYAVLALCDGMGGARAGGIASEIALNSFTEQVTESLSDKKNKVNLSDFATATPATLPAAAALAIRKFISDSCN